MVDDIIFKRKKADIYKQTISVIDKLLYEAKRVLSSCKPYKLNFNGTRPTFSPFITIYMGKTVYTGVTTGMLATLLMRYRGCLGSHQCGTIESQNIDTLPVGTSGQ